MSLFANMSLTTIVAYVVGWWGLGTAIVVGALFVAWFIPPLRSLAVAVAVCVAAGTVLGAWQFKTGYDRAVHDVAAQNGKVIERVQAKQREIDACRASGREWDLENGKCA
jgi:uncharacterized membrane protein